MPRVAVMSALAVAAVVLGLVLTRPGGGGRPAGGEVFLQAADAPGPDPFTESSAVQSSAAPRTPTPAAPTEPVNVTRAVDGSAPGLYGGTRNTASCDTEKQIRTLQADPAKNGAFASVAGVRPSGVPAYLRSLTPVRLRMDTRVTNHGYRNGAATAYQAILQAGTAVLVDPHGVPRVRCACGNPLTPPVAQKSTPRQTGDRWPGFRPQNVVVVSPSPRVITTFVLFDADHDAWFDRRRGDHTGRHDRTTRPPARPVPSVSVSTPAPHTASPSATPSSPPPVPSHPPASSPSPPAPPSSPATTPSPRPTPPSSPASGPPSPGEPSSAPTSASASASASPPASAPFAPPEPPATARSGPWRPSAGDWGTHRWVRALVRHPSGGDAAPYEPRCASEPA